MNCQDGDGWLCELEGHEHSAGDTNQDHGDLYAPVPAKPSRESGS